MAFELLTTFSHDTCYSIPDHVLQEHYDRLQAAHKHFASDESSGFQSDVFPPFVDLQWALISAMKRQQGLARIRLTVNADAKISVACTPMKATPAYPVTIVLDDRSTDYSTPFTRFKTTKREMYDQPRDRHGASLVPSQASDPPFDVLLYNDRGQVTETTIANVAFSLPGRDKLITPAESCGLLPGLTRAKMLQQNAFREGIVTIEDLRRAQEQGGLEIRLFNAVRGTMFAKLATSS